MTASPGAPEAANADRIRLSALVVAHDEAHQLGECLAGLAFCDEIVVLLDRCSDGSREVALGYTDRVVEGAWPIEGSRRQAGVDACGGEWIFETDADERVSPDLAAELRATIEGSRFDCHRVPYDNYVGKRLVRYGWGAQFGVGSRSCLYRKGVKSWGAERVHPKLVWKAGVRQGPPLRHRMVHFVDRDISDMIQRLDRYTTARALDLRDSGDIGSAFHNYRRIVSRFWKCFVGRKGYREGGLGFLIALCAALYPILSYLKARHAGEIEGAGK
jgi:glycosyltransferase involved in cell wall biosynthesis